jgi:hypothetical protein
VVTSPFRLPTLGEYPGSVLADGVENKYLWDVPKDPSGTLLLNAYANSGYRFLHWIIYPSSGGSYFSGNSSLSVPLNSSDYHFHAEFQKLED